MSRIGKLLFGVLVVACLVGASLAAGQDQTPPAQSTPAQQPSSPAGASAPGAEPHRTLEAQAEMRWLSQQLNLTPEQREKLRPIVMEEGLQLNNVRLNEHLPADQKKAKTQEIRETYRPKIMAVLTPEQQEKWKKMQEETKAKHEERMKSGDTEPTPPKPQ